MIVSIKVQIQDDRLLNDYNFLLRNYFLRNNQANYSQKFAIYCRQQKVLQDWLSLSNFNSSLLDMTKSGTWITSKFGAKWNDSLTKSGQFIISKAQCKSHCILTFFVFGYVPQQKKFSIHTSRLHTFHNTIASMITGTSCMKKCLITVYIQFQ